MTPEYYADIYRQYATFMPGWSSGVDITRIASGASSDDYNWTEVLMKKVPQSLMEAVALHHYSVIDWSNKGSDKNFSEEQYFIIMQKALEIEELITRHVTIMDRYDPDKNVDLFVDEWGGWYDSKDSLGVLYQQNTMRDAMIAGTTLNSFNNHADRVKMANLVQTINVLQAVILTNEEKMILTPTYYVMKMYNVHQNSTLLPMSMQNVSYTFNNEELPALSASASIDQNGTKNISLVNIDSRKNHTAEIEIRGETFKNISATILSSAALQDHNTFENPEKIKPRNFDDFNSKNGVVRIKLPPFSVVVLELK